MAGAGMKLQPPDKYDGETDCERFSKLLHAYMVCQDNDYCGMLEAAAQRPVPITNTEIAAMAATSVTSGREYGEFRFADILWYLIITASTIGYGDYFPVTDLGKIFAIFYISSKFNKVYYMFICLINIMISCF